MNKYKPENIADKVIEHCIKNSIRFVFISGNGASGKSHFAKLLVGKAKDKGHINLISTDDFVVDSSLRNNSKATWVDKDGIEQTGRYTTSFKESYFLKSINSIRCNLSNGNDYYHFPKKALSKSDSIHLRSKAPITIIEGVGSVYVDKDELESFDIFIECSEELEISRRNKRREKSNEGTTEEIRKLFKERRSQYSALVQPYKQSADLVLESLEDFSFDLVKGDV